jgi:hypothetical protein
LQQKVQNLAPALAPVLAPISSDIPEIPLKCDKLINIPRVFGRHLRECVAARPGVNGILKEYKSCLQLGCINFHSKTKWHEMLYSLGMPVFLMDASEKVLYRWIGFNEEEEFISFRSVVQWVKDSNKSLDANPVERSIGILQRAVLL